MDFVNSALIATGGLPLVDSWQVITPSKMTGVKYYDGYVYACGEYPSLGRIYVYKFGPDGEFIWKNSKNQYIGPSNYKIYPRGITVNSSGIFVISTGEGNPSFLMKYDFDGNLLFSKSIRQGSSATSFVCIDSTETEVIIGGYASSNGLVMSFDNSGNINWQKSYSKTGNSTILGLCIDEGASNDIYVAGKTVSTMSGIGGNAGLVMRLNSSGVIQSQQQWSSGDGFDVDLTSIHVNTTVSGTFGYVVGHEKSSAGVYSGIAVACDASGFNSVLGYFTYKDGSNNIKFNSVKVVRVGASGIPRICGSYSSTQAIILKQSSTNFVGKKFGSTHAGDEIWLNGTDIYSCLSTDSFSTGALVKLTDSTLTDAIASTWGPSAITDVNQVSSSSSAVSGAVSMTEATTSLNISTNPYTVTDQGAAATYNYNYSNKAV